MTEIIGMSEHVGQMIAQIATASSQQLAAVEQISNPAGQGLVTPRRAANAAGFSRPRPSAA